MRIYAIIELADINKIDFSKFSLKKNKIINYNTKTKKNKLLKIFTNG